MPAPSSDSGSEQLSKVPKKGRSDDVSSESTSRKEALQAEETAKRTAEEAAKKAQLTATQKSLSDKMKEFTARIQAEQRSGQGGSTQGSARSQQVR